MRQAAHPPASCCQIRRRRCGRKVCTGLPTRIASTLDLCLLDQSPPPTLKCGVGKGRAAPPPPWFPPLEPSFRGPLQQLEDFLRYELLRRS